MIDITQNTTPHGLLREIDPEAAAALEAWPHGVEFWSMMHGGKWVSARPEWDETTVYRAIPAPKRVVRWVNLYIREIGDAWPTRKQANDSRTNAECIAVLRIEQAEGGSNVTVTVEDV